MIDIIEKEKYVHLKPPMSEDINHENAVIQIRTLNSDAISNPSLSSLIVRGKVVETKTADSSVSATIDPTKVKIAVLQLFSSIEYYLGMTKVASINNPGYTTLIKGLLSFSDVLSYGNTGWKLTGDVLNTSGYFSVCIPLKIILPIFEDNKGFIYRQNQELHLIRSRKINNALWVDSTLAGTHNHDVKLTNIIWVLPEYKLSLLYEDKINKEFIKNTMYEFEFKNWIHMQKSGFTENKFSYETPVKYNKPRGIICAFQKNRENQIKVDNSVFDSCNIQNVQVYLNGECYPNQRLNIKIDENKCEIPYDMYLGFQKAYYGLFQPNKPVVSYEDFKSKYFLLYFDLSYQPLTIKDTICDVKIDFEFYDSITPDVMFHIIIITENSLIYNPVTNDVKVY
jgi:hypothetical protein